MFKKLEDRKLVTFLGKSSSGGEICGCRCKAIQSPGKEPAVESSEAVVLLGVNVQLNG